MACWSGLLAWDIGLDGPQALRMPAVLVRSHGPFTWGRDARRAAENAIALEATAAMAHRTLTLEPGAPEVQEALLRRHFDRKHGPGAYYGQAKGSC